MTKQRGCLILLSTGFASYTALQWLMLFYCYCFFGWCFESAYVSLRQHRFVNRGFVRLPLLPIYGSGALCILIFCLPYHENPLLVFVLGIILPTILEYAVGWSMERLFKMTYWDYSSQKFNLNGYICLSSSIAWGVLSMLLIYVIHPPIGRLIVSLPVIPSLCVVIPLTAVFAVDFVMAFRTALNLRRILEDLEQLRTQLDELRVQIELAQAEAREQVETLRLTARSEMLRRQMQRRVSNMIRHYHIRALLRAHPTASSHLFADPLRAARERSLAFRRSVEKAVEAVEEARDWTR